MKGISPLIATVLLVALTVAIASVVTTWMTTLSKEKSSVIGNKTDVAIDCTAANIDVKDVYVDFSSNISRTIVWNSGQVGISVTDASLFNKQGESAVLNSTLPVSLSPGSMATIRFNVSGVFSNCLNFSQVLVSTDCVGISDRFTGTPKGC
jgi:flagellin-like protein